MTNRAQTPDRTLTPVRTPTLTSARTPDRQTADDGDKARRSLRPLATLWPYMMRYRGRVAAAFAALVAAALVTLALPLAIRRMIDFGFTDENAAFVNNYFAMLVLIAGLLAVASATRYYLVTTLGERIVTDLRSDLFAHLMHLSPAFFDTARSGEIISRLTADTTQIKSAVGASASIALRNLVLFIGASIMMVITSARLSALVLLVIPFIVLPIVAFGRRVRKRSRFAQDMLADAAAYATEIIGGIRTVQAFTHERDAKGRFSSLVELAFGAARSATGTRACLTAFAIFLVFASVVGVLWWGAQAVLAGQMTPGRLGQFVLYSIFAAGALGELSQVWGEISQAAGATERIAELLQTRSDIVAPDNPRPIPNPVAGAIALHGVSFTYGAGNGAVLNDVTLAVAPGERVAVVGPSGAGKSTLFSLLMRFYDPEAGTVTLDGVDLRNTDPAELRAHLALVAQDPMIFAASVIDNIRFGKLGADEASVRAAAEGAYADEFIRALPDGYRTILGERGITLSGGQRQRIAIARAILKDSPVLLLDEATSALDAQSETAVQAALEHLMQGRTSLVIAHRLATIKSADRILVMDEGRIVEEGSHDALIARDGLYARLARLQFDLGNTKGP